MLKTPNNILSHLEDLDYGRNTDICTLKKERGGIFSECCTKIFNEQFLHYINEVRFEMVEHT